MTTVITLIITLVNIILAWVMWNRLGRQSVINDILRAYDAACRLNEEQSRAIDRLKRERAELINEINKPKQQ